MIGCLSGHAETKEKMIYESGILDAFAQHVGNLSELPQAQIQVKGSELETELTLASMSNHSASERLLEKPQFSLAALVRATQDSPHSDSKLIELEDDMEEDEGDESASSDDNSLKTEPLVSVQDSQEQFFRWFASQYRRSPGAVVKLKAVYDSFKQTEIWLQLPRRAKFTYARLCELIGQHATLGADFRARLQQQLGYARDVLVGWDYQAATGEMDDMISALLCLSEPGNITAKASNTMLNLITAATDEAKPQTKRHTRSTNAAYQRWNEERKLKQERPSISTHTSMSALMSVLASHEPVDNAAKAPMPANVREILEDAKLGLVIKNWKKDRREKGVYWVYDGDSKYKLDTVVGTAALCAAGSERLVFGPSAVMQPDLSPAATEKALTASPEKPPQPEGNTEPLESSKGLTISQSSFDTVLSFFRCSLQRGSFGGSSSPLSPTCSCILHKRVVYSLYRSFCDQEGFFSSSLTSPSFFRVAHYLIPKAKSCQIRKVSAIEFPNLNICRESVELNKDWPQNGVFPLYPTKGTNDDGEDKPLPEAVCKLLIEAKMSPVALSWHEDAQSKGVYWLRKIEGRHKVNTVTNCIWYWPPRNRKHVVLYPASNADLSQVPQAPIVKPDSNQVPQEPIGKPDASQLPQTPIDKPDASQVPQAPIVKPDDASQLPQAPIVKPDSNQVPQASIVKPDSSQIVKPEPSPSEPLNPEASTSITKGSAGIHWQRGSRRLAQSPECIPNSDSPLSTSSQSKTSPATDSLQPSNSAAAPNSPTPKQQNPQDNPEERPPVSKTKKRGSLKATRLASSVEISSPTKGAKKTPESADSMQPNDSSEKVEIHEEAPYVEETLSTPKKEPSLKRKKVAAQLEPQTSVDLDSCAKNKRSRKPNAEGRVQELLQRGLQRWSSRLQGATVECAPELPRRKKQPKRETSTETESKNDSPIPKKQAAIPSVASSIVLEAKPEIPEVVTKHQSAEINAPYPILEDSKLVSTSATIDGSQAANMPKGRLATDSISIDAPEPTAQAFEASMPISDDSLLMPTVQEKFAISNDLEKIAEAQPDQVSVQMDQDDHEPQPPELPPRLDSSSVLPARSSEVARNHSDRRRRPRTQPVLTAPSWMIYDKEARTLDVPPAATIKDLPRSHHRHDERASFPQRERSSDAPKENRSSFDRSSKQEPSNPNRQYPGDSRGAHFEGREQRYHQEDRQRFDTERRYDRSRSHNRSDRSESRTSVSQAFKSSQEWHGRDDFKNQIRRSDSHRSTSRPRDEARSHDNRQDDERSRQDGERSRQDGEHRQDDKRSRQDGGWDRQDGDRRWQEDQRRWQEGERSRSRGSYWNDPVPERSASRYAPRPSSRSGDRSQRLENRASHPEHKNDYFHGKNWRKTPTPDTYRDTINRH